MGILLHFQSCEYAGFRYYAALKEEDPNHLVWIDINMDLYDYTWKRLCLWWKLTDTFDLFNEGPGSYADEAGIRTAMSRAIHDNYGKGATWHRGIEDRDPAQPAIGLDDQRHDVDGRIDVDPELERAVAERAVAADRRGDDRPAHRLACQERGDLAMRQRRVGEVVERTLSGSRLVDGLDDDRGLGLGAFEPDAAQHRVVRRPHQPPDDLDLAVAEHLEGAGGLDHHRPRRAERVQLSCPGLS